MSQIDVLVVNPFLASVVEVLGTMAQVRAVPGQPYLKTDRSARGDVSGVIGLSGEVDGTVSVTFSKDCACAVVGNMLGERVEDIDQTVIDAVGELTNMISGRARQGLEKNGRTFNAAIPTVIAGAGHSITHCADPVLCLEFKTLYGPVAVEVAFGKAQANACAAANG